MAVVLVRDKLRKRVEDDMLSDYDQNRKANGASKDLDSESEEESDDSAFGSGCDEYRKKKTSKLKKPCKNGSAGTLDVQSEALLSSPLAEVQALEVSAETSREWNENGVCYNLETSHDKMFELPELKTRQIDPKLLQFPQVAEEEVGTFKHPTHARFEAFSKHHGWMFKQHIVDQAPNIPFRQIEINGYATSWIRARLRGVKPVDPVTKRILAMYNHITANLTEQTCREITLITRFRNKPGLLTYMEIHLSYRYDTCYDSLKETSRGSYKPVIRSP
ncbi:unnamed protein product [Caenorhabditis sp. 36 PRJEB53466]|nr:unnamed protein product [Caenorhabditis sp. 36 PRJEB53466]